MSPHPYPDEAIRSAITELRVAVQKLACIAASGTRQTVIPPAEELASVLDVIGSCLDVIETETKCMQESEASS